MIIESSLNGKPMTITLVAFAMLGELLPQNPLSYEVHETMTAGELFQELSKTFPAMASLLTVTHLACDEDYVAEGDRLRAGKEYYLIPPVSGG